MASERPTKTRQITQSYSQAGPYVSLGVQFTLTILICLFGGRWLDAKLSTTPLFLLVGTLAGAVVAFYKLYRTLTELNEKERALKEKNKRGPS